MKSGKFKSTIVFCLALAAALAVGCRNLEVTDKPVTGIVLPKTQMESDSVAVRVAVVELDDQQKTEFKSFIESTDQKLPLEMRKRLDDNGVRVSVISNVNTSSLQKMLAPGIQKPEWLSGQAQELAEAGKLEPIYRLASHRHVEKKRGESFTVEVSSVRRKSSWVIHLGKQQLSDFAELAQCQMRITSWPLPDGSVKLQFMPEVHHGQKLSRIGVDHSNFAVHQRRDVKELRSLAFDVTVLPNETVVIAPTQQLERIGELFFNAAAGVEPDRCHDGFQREVLFDLPFGSSVYRVDPARFDVRYIHSRVNVVACAVNCVSLELCFGLNSFSIPSIPKGIKNVFLQSKAQL